MDDEPRQHTASILLVDDEESVRQLLGRALSADGHQVDSVGTLAGAIKLIDERDYSLLLIDKNLPDGSGLRIVERMRELERDCEAIVITGYSDTDSAIRAVALGVFRYVRKPFDLDALRLDINGALEIGRLRRNLERRTREIEQRNEELNEALQRIRESEQRRMRSERLATLGYLAAGVAHEINNPMSLLSMTIPYAANEIEIQLDRLESEDGKLDPQRIGESLRRLSRSLEPASEAIELLMSLASDLHTLGKTEPRAPRPVRLVEAAESSARLVRHQLKRKATLEIDLPPDLVVSGQQNRLIQVFINLLTNAARAIDKGGVEDNLVAIRGRREGDRAVIEVSDTGKGIPEPSRKMIFDRFFTEPASGQEPGFGIGLSIVSEVIDDHGGEIAVESEENRGTTFTLSLPLMSDAAASSPAMAVVGSGGEMVRTRRTLLFVDPEPDNLSSYEKSFGQMHEVLLASDSDEARGVLQQRAEELDAVVCDLSGGGDQLQRFFAETVAENADLEGRFIFLQAPESFEAVDVGGCKLLRKPVRPASLLAAIYEIPPRRPSS